MGLQGQQILYIYIWMLSRNAANSLTEKAGPTKRLFFLRKIEKNSGLAKVCGKMGYGLMTCGFLVALEALTHSSQTRNRQREIKSDIQH